MDLELPIIQHTKGMALQLAFEIDLQFCHHQLSVDRIGE
jgi:hypothetical protein